MGMNSLSTFSRVTGKELLGKPVAYVDLEKIFENVETIDLLKCDIEGSEADLINNYGDLFKKVKVAVFEFHHELCDVAGLEERLASSGLFRKTIVQDLGSTSVRLFTRHRPVS